MLVIANAFDVVPSRRLVALVTLVDFGDGLAGHLGRNHLKMHHVMARRGLVALGAIRGFWRRMSELWDRPFGRPVALGAVLAEEFEVPILGGMAGRAIQDRLLRGEARMAFQPVALRLVLADPVKKVFPHEFVDTV